MQFEKVWILISWLHQKPADLDLHCFQKSIKFLKKFIHSALIEWNTVYNSIVTETEIDRRELL